MTQEQEYFVMEEKAPYDEYFNMSLPQLCHTFNASILEALNLTADCSNRPELHSVFGTFVEIFYALVCILGLCGNTLVIYVVLRYSKMQTVTYIYILMLAIADEIFLLGIPFLITTMIQRNWVFGFHMCKIYYTTTSINQVINSNARAKRAVVANLQYGNISVYQFHIFDGTLR